MSQSPALATLSAEHRATVAGCASNAVFVLGASLMREGDPADVFYIVREGTVAIETQVPGRGAVTLQTLHADDLLGWSWLLEPYRARFDARALDQTRAFAFDAACLRGKCDADPALGYAVLKLLAGVLAGRLASTRLRLLDVYGPASDARA